MWSVATTTFNGILSGTSEKGREMHLLSVSGIVPSCPTIRYDRWRKHTQRKGNISGIQQPGSRLKREIRNDLPSSSLLHQLPDVCLDIMSQGNGQLLPVYIHKIPLCLLQGREWLNTIVSNLSMYEECQFLW